jgi:hypothetical protein
VRIFARRLAAVYGVVRSGSATSSGRWRSRSSAPPPCARTASAPGRRPASTAAIDGSTAPQVDAQKVTRPSSSAVSSWPPWPTPRWSSSGSCWVSPATSRPAPWWPSCSSSRVRGPGPDGERGAQRGAERRGGFPPGPRRHRHRTRRPRPPPSPTRRASGAAAGPLGVRFDPCPSLRPRRPLALDGVDLTLEPQRRVAIVGRPARARRPSPSW